MSNVRLSAHPRGGTDDERLAVYEEQAFAAGVVRVRLDRIRELVDAGAPPGDALRQEAEEAEAAVAEWQQRSAKLLQYPHARGLPVCPECGRRVGVHDASYCPHCGQPLGGPYQPALQLVA